MKIVDFAGSRPTESQSMAICSVFSAIEEVSS